VQEFVIKNSAILRLPSSIVLAGILSGRTKMSCGVNGCKHLKPMLAINKHYFIQFCDCSRKLFVASQINQKFKKNYKQN
jgi:hypothetical protein